MNSNREYQLINLIDFQSRLLALRDRGKPLKESRGICYQIMFLDGIYFEGWYKKTYSVVTLVSELSKGWPHHSGDHTWPVPAPLNPTDKLWESEQGKLRWDLVDYLIVQAEKKMAELTQKSE